MLLYRDEQRAVSRHAAYVSTIEWLDRVDVHTQAWTPRAPIVRAASRQRDVFTPVVIIATSHPAA